MKLTATHRTVMLFAPRNIEVGRENPCFTGAKTPLSLVVFSFLRRSFVTDLIRAKFVMTGSHGKPLRLAAPVSGILTPFSPAAKTVRSIWLVAFQFLQEQVA